MKIKEVIVENKDVRSLNERKRKRKRKPTTRTVYGGWWGGYPLDNSSGEGGGEGVAEDSLNEFAPTAGAGDDILKTLATQWLHGDIASGDLSSDIQSQEQIERRLEKGIICPDGVKRKLYIDYNQDYDGVIIYGDDDWSIEYKQDDLTESKQGVAEANITSDDLTTEFIEHYKNDPVGMFMHAKSSYLDAVGKAKNFSVYAANLSRSHESMSKNEFQDTVIKHFGVHLKKHDWPKHASPAWGEAEYDLIKELSNGVAEGVPQPGKSSGKPISWISPERAITKYLTLDEILNSVQGIPYYNEVVKDRDAKDFTWGVTKKVIEYAIELIVRPDAYKNWPPIIVVDGKLQDGAHRISTINLMQKRVQPNNPIWKNAKLKVEFGKSDNVRQGVAEASSSAQQAAIAVAMKRAGKKPKIKEGVVIKGPWKGSGEEPPENKDDEKSGLIRALRNKLDQYSESRKKRKYIQIANKFTDMAHKAMEQAEQLPITDPNKLKYQRQLKHCFDLAKYYSMLGGEEPYSQGFISMMRRTFPNLTKDPFENE